VIGNDGRQALAQASHRITMATRAAKLAYDQAQRGPPFEGQARRTVTGPLLENRWGLRHCGAPIACGQIGQSRGGVARPRSSNLPGKAQDVLSPDGTVGGGRGRTLPSGSNAQIRLIGSS